jgi:hypothetical protein
MEVTDKVEICSESHRKKKTLLCVMLSLVLFSTTLVFAVIGLPPVIIKQPVDVEIFFKVSLSGAVHKPFEIECEAEGDPAPK